MAQFDRAVAIRRREQGDEDADTLKALRQLVAIDANLRRWDLPKRACSRCSRCKAGGSVPITRIRCSTLDLAGIYLSWGKLEQAEPLAARRGRAPANAGPGSQGHHRRADDSNGDLRAAKKFADALRVGEEAHAAARRTLGEKDSLTIRLESGLQQRGAGALGGSRRASRGP